MGSAAKQKQRERFLLDRFLEHQRISATDIQQLDPPNPDVLIEIQGRKVGIELTELFVRSKTPGTRLTPAEERLPQQVEWITDRIVSKARKVYFDGDNPPVISTVVFSNRITLDKKNGDQIANLIADKIRSIGIQNSQVIDWRPSEYEEENSLLSESVVFIHARRVPESRFARWTVARSGSVVFLTPKHLQDRIDEKAKKIKTYKKSTGEIWLLIVADRTRPSQKFMLSPSLLLNSISSPFTKTFYYGYGAGEVIEF